MYVSLFLTMWWKRSKTDASLPAPPVSASAASSADIAELWRAVKALQGAIEDLDDRARRFQARARKRWSVDEAEEAAPADGAAAGARPRAVNGATVGALRAAGRWPLR
jgi:hypothetical protein